MKTHALFVHSRTLLAEDTLSVFPDKTRRIHTAKCVCGWSHTASASLQGARSEYMVHLAEVTANLLEEMNDRR